MPETREGLLLDLTHPLARDAKLRADLLERHRLRPINPEVQPQDLRLALLEAAEGILDRFGERLLEGLLVGRGVVRIGQIVQQAVVLARGQRRIERQVHLRDRHRLGDFFLGDVHPFGDLGVRCLAPQLLQQRVRALADAMQRAGPVERHAHDARLLCQRLQNCLPDPPDGIRNELDALRLIELVRGANEAKVSLVDQVGQRHALILVLLRHGHHEAQVRPHQLVQPVLIANPDPSCKFCFFFP